MSFIDENGFAFIWSQIKAKFQGKEFKTGSSTVYKELTDNNLTDTLKSNYDDAYTLTSSLTATATELNQLDGVTLGTAAEGTISTSGVGNNSTNLVTEAQVKTYVDGAAGADIDDTAGDGDTDKVWSANKVYDELATKVDSTDIGANSGICPLDSAGKVDSTYLPSYVDDVVEGYYYNGAFYSDSAHTQTITAETSKIYIDLSTEESYRYSGTVYVKITNGALSPLTNTEITNIINAS